MMRWDKRLMWILFYLVMLGIGLCVAGVITFRWTATTDLTAWQKGLTFLILTGVFMSPFLLKCPPHCLNGKICIAFLYMAYFGFVCLFLFFCLVFVRDAIWLAGRVCHIGPSLVEPMAVLKANIGLLILVISLAAYALWEGVRVPAVREVRLTSDKIQEPLTIVVLSDIHLSRMVARHKVQEIVKKTNEIKPDLILLPGDIMDDEPVFIADLVEELKGLQAPLGVYATDGNHEIYKDRNVAHQEFQTANLHYLENNGVWVRPDVWVGGVPDIQIERKGEKVEMSKAFPDQKGLTVLLAHTPKMFDMPKNSADLQVSGHTHGGQIFPFHILSWLSNRYLAGLYQQGHRYLYVSRGSGQWGPQMRLFAPAEISVIKLYPDKAVFK